MFDAKKLESLQADIEEVKDILKASEERRNAQYTDIMVAIKELASLLENAQNSEFDEDSDEDELDESFEEVKNLVLKEQKASTSFLQRNFGFGYGRAARLIDQLEEQGVIAPSDGRSATRKVIVTE